MKAFPTTMDNEGFQIDHQGMDLRDYFAAKAMTIIATQYPSTNAIGCAELAYEYADAMLKIRG
jgi:hypothetical protein